MKRGAQTGNQHAVKTGPKRKLVTLSFSDERLAAVMRYLETQGKQTSIEHLRELAYAAIDAYVK